MSSADRGRGVEVGDEEELDDTTLDPPDEETCSNCGWPAGGLRGGLCYTCHEWALTEHRRNQRGL